MSRNFCQLIKETPGIMAAWEMERSERGLHARDGKAESNACDEWLRQVHKEKYKSFNEFHHCRVISNKLKQLGLSDLFMTVMGNLANFLDPRH
jgi:hypothetical protein